MWSICIFWPRTYFQNYSIHRYIECMMSYKRKNRFGSRCEGVCIYGGIAGEGRVVGIPMFHFWGKCTMPLTNINSDWMPNASYGLCTIYLYYAGPLIRTLGCNHFTASIFKHSLIAHTQWIICSNLLLPIKPITQPHLQLPTKGA